MKHRTSLRISFDSHESTSAEPLRERLRLAVQGESCRDVGERTATHPETVRRYLSNGTPSTDFIRNVAEAYGISADWLLCGRGCAMRHDQLDATLRTASFRQLLEALGDRLGSIDAALRVGAMPPSRSDRQIEMKTNSLSSKHSRDFSDRPFLNSRST